ARRQEPVGHLQRGEHPARAVGDVEREGALRADVLSRVLARVLAVRVDVVLDDRCERRLAEQPVVVQPRVQEGVHLDRTPPGPPRRPQVASTWWPTRAASTVRRTIPVSMPDASATSATRSPGRM